MDFYVYSRNALDAARPHDVPHVIISITSSPEDIARLRANKMCRGVLRLSFLDADAPSDQYTEDVLFSQEQAMKVWQFIVHCDAGVSRSPAVATAISKVLMGDDTEFFGGRYRPNMRVYRTLLEGHESLPGA